MMARPREIWPDAKIQRARELANAGLSAGDICFLLEDEFGGTCSVETLHDRMNEHAIARPSRAAAGRRNAMLPSWSDAKIARFVELWNADLSRRKISRLLQAEFDLTPRHMLSTLNRKARELGLKRTPASSGDSDPSMRNGRTEGDI